MIPLSVVLNLLYGNDITQTADDQFGLRTCSWGGKGRVRDREPAEETRSNRSRSATAPFVQIVRIANHPPADYSHNDFFPKDKGQGFT